MNEWLNSPGQIIRDILAFVSLVIAIVFYVKGKREKRPMYAMKSFTILNRPNGKLNAVKIFYSDKEIERLTVTRVAVWNAGKDTIDGKDITETEPLRLEVDDSAKLLGYEVNQKEGTANNIVVTNLDSGLLISFDYLDFQDGLVIELIHTGLSGEEISVKGVLKGATKLKNASETRPVYTVGVVMLFLSAAILSGWIAGSVQVFIEKRNFPDWLVGVSPFPIFLFSLYALVSILDKLFFIRVAPGFKDFEKKIST